MKLRFLTIGLVVLLAGCATNSACGETDAYMKEHCPGGYRCEVGTIRNCFQPAKPANFEAYKDSCSCIKHKWNAVETLDSCRYTASGVRLGCKNKTINVMECIEYSCPFDI